MLSHRLRITAGVILMLVLITQMSGCGGGAIAGLMSFLEITKATTIIPDDWTSDGGIIKILADIAGDGIREVRAFIKRLGDSDAKPIVLTLNSKGEYEGTYEAEANTSSTEPDTYSVVVTATDDTGTAVASDPVSFEVPAADNP